MKDFGPCEVNTMPITSNPCIKFKRGKKRTVTILK